MGSCVSQCSRQKALQTGRKNIEVEHVVKVNKGREQTETKNYVNEDEVGIHLDPVMTTNLYDDVQMSSEDNHLVTDLSTSDVREQINMEMRALRTQIVRSNALLSYLQTKENLINYQQKSVHILRKQNLSLEEQNADSFDGQVPSLCYNNANRSSSSITSHKSTPLHKSCLAQSCPILPSEISAISRSTQTEPLKLMESICENQGKQKAEVLSSGDLSYQRHCDSFPISDSTNLKRFVQIAQHPEILPDHSPTRMKATQFNLNESPVSPHFPRHRSHSFLIAVKQGNPKLVDANFHEKQSGSDKVKSSLNSEPDIETVSKISHPYFGSSSSVAKKCVSLDVTSSNRGLLSSSGGSRECLLPRKLSILLEEDLEDSSGNHFTHFTLQSTPERSETLDSCDVQTQTTFDECYSQNLRNFTQIVQEHCDPQEASIPGHNVICVPHVKTYFTGDFQRSQLFQHPPPYKKPPPPPYRSTGNIHFGEFPPKSHIWKWPTVAESLPTQSGSMHYLAQGMMYGTNLQTRHLSLEKQDSFPSNYDQNWYPENQLPSDPESSSWITKSNAEIYTYKDVPACQQTLPANRGHQPLKNRSTSLPLEHEHTPGNTFSKSYDAGDSNVKEITAKERIVSTEEKVKEGKPFDKTGKNPQRSVRRGSGTGSPNSLLSIPRYPAFDLSEQEDVHGLINPLTDSKIIKDANPVSNETIVNADACNDHEMQPKSPVLRLKDASQKKREASKSKTLMPDLMETSETESAKGSFEYETPEVILPSETSSSLDSAFPSLKDLVELGVSKDSPHPPETFSEAELQDKFATLSLAFKTDKMTLSKRVELQKRQRDNAEKEVEREIKTLKNSLNILSLNCTSSDARDLISKVQNDIDSVQNATLRMSGRSEAYGALQQEERVCRAFEVLLLHVDILKRSLDREHRELEEARRILSGTKALAKEIGSAEVISDDSKKSLRTIGLAVGTLKSTVRRRASVSVLHPHTLPDGVKARSFSSSWTAGSGNFKDTKNRLISALCPFTSTGSIGLISSSSSSTYLSAPLSPSYSSVCSEIDRRCSLPVSPGRALIGHNASRITEIEKGSSFSSGIPEKEIVEQNLKNTQQLYVVSDIEEQPEEEVVFEEETSLIDESSPKGGEDCTDNVVSNSCRLSDISENIEGNEALYNSETMKSELDISTEKADIKRKKSFVEKYSSPKLLEHWNKTSGLTLFRYSVSMLLIVMAVLCFLVIFLPCQAIPKESENFEDAMELILQTYFRPKYLDKPV